MVVQDIDAKITNLVGRLTPAVVRSVLPGAPPGGEAEVDMTRRFRALAGRLTGLGDQVRTDAGLSTAVGAKVSTTQGENPRLLGMELQPRLVESVSSGYANTLKVLHELTHSLQEGAVFPVKDYAYRTEWAWGYLTPALSAVNADSYAELAARIAEDEAQRPGRYGKYGPLPAQREYLRGEAGRSVLGAALAWVDLVLNRAWIRAFGAYAHALVEVEDTELERRKADWKADAEFRALVAFEERLVSAQIVDARFSRFGTNRLGLTDRWVVGEIAERLTEAKQLLSRLVVVPLTTDGRHVSLDASSGTLLVSRGVAADTPVQLGERILEALLAVVAPSGLVVPKYATRLRDIVDWLRYNDRPQEKAALTPLLDALGRLPAVATAPGQWDALAQGLPRAVLADIAVRWRLVATHAADVAQLPEPQRQPLRRLDLELLKDVGAATVAAGKLAGTAAELDALLAAVDAVAARALPHFADDAPHYEQLRGRLRPLRR
nr:hypothetical protein [Kitasatospora sp. SID7827]